MMTVPFFDVVAGARPNFMKVAPILRAARSGDDRLVPKLVHTGQHYDADMSDVFFAQLGIAKPDVHLGVGSGSHGAQTARVLTAYEERLLAERPRGVVVVGDVNSTLACTLAAVKLGIPVAHVEAGLRSFDRAMPEEINRVMTDAVADLLLVSEPSGVENLEREGITGSRVELVGNVMIDTLVAELPAARAASPRADIGLEARGYAYVTLHRPSNVDDPERLGTLVALLVRISEKLPVAFAVHPRTRDRLERAGRLPDLEVAPGVRLLPPQGYRESLALMADAAVALTDSGGIPEETTYLGVPCLTVRPNTERPVTVEVGTNTIVGDALDRIEPLVDDVLAGRYKRGEPVPLWDGHAAERIVQRLQERWGG